MGVRLRSLVLVGVLGSLVTVWALPVAADTTATFADSFASQSFAGNDGDLAFAAPWQELGTPNGPEAGPVYVWADTHCAGGSGWCLKIGGDGVNIDGAGVVREAETGEATSAVLRYSFRRALFDDYDNGAWVKVQVSGDGGETWKTVARHKLNRSDAKDKHKQHDITDYLGPTTQVRFIGGPADAVEAYIYIDDIELEASMAPPTTTTTTTTTTITPTTSITAPPATTTTTTSALPATTTTSTTTTTTTAIATATATTTVPPSEPVALSPHPQVVAGAPPAGPTTTTPDVAGEPPEAPIAPGRLPSEPGTYESFISKAGLTVTGAMPTYYSPGDGATGTGEDGTAEPSRTPVDRLAVTFSTATETLRSYSMTAVALGVLVAWLALRGLGRTRHRDET